MQSLLKSRVTLQLTTLSNTIIKNMIGAKAKILIKIMINTLYGNPFILKNVIENSADAYFAVLTPECFDFLKRRPDPVHKLVNFSISIASALGVDALGSIIVDVFWAAGSLENFTTIIYRPLLVARTGCFFTDSTSPFNLVLLLYKAANGRWRGLYFIES